MNHGQQKAHSSTVSGNGSKPETTANPTAGQPVPPVTEKQASTLMKGEQTPNKLTVLGRKIRNGHARIIGQVKMSTEVAREIGRHLVAAQELVEDGGWTLWLKKRCKMTIRQSQKYMRLAKRWDDLVKDGHDPANFTIEQNLALLNSPAGTLPEISREAPQRPGLPEDAFKVAGEKELKEKRVIAEDLESLGKLDFSEGKSAAKFVKATTDYVRRQIRKQVRKHVLDLKDGLDPAAAALAILNKIRNELTAKVVLDVTEGDGFFEPGMVPVHPPTNRLNGAAALAAAG